MERLHVREHLAAVSLRRKLSKRTIGVAELDAAANRNCINRHRISRCTRKHQRVRACDRQILLHVESRGLAGCDGERTSRRAVDGDIECPDRRGGGRRNAQHLRKSRVLRCHVEVHRCRRRTSLEFLCAVVCRAEFHKVCSWPREHLTHLVRAQRPFPRRKRLDAATKGTYALSRRIIPVATAAVCIRTSQHDSTGRRTRWRSRIAVHFIRGDAVRTFLKGIDRHLTVLDRHSEISPFVRLDLRIRCAIPGFPIDTCRICIVAAIAHDCNEKTIVSAVARAKNIVLHAISRRRFAAPPVTDEERAFLRQIDGEWRGEVDSPRVVFRRAEIDILREIGNRLAAARLRVGVDHVLRAKDDTRVAIVYLSRPCRSAAGGTANHVCGVGGIGDEQRFGELRLADVHDAVAVRIDESLSPRLRVAEYVARMGNDRRKRQTDRNASD